MTDRYLVIGNPVSHSQSPFIHAEFARQTGQAMTYDRLLCAPDGFVQALETFGSEGGCGCNVTVPFKFEAFRIARAHTPRATTAGACNALRRDGDGWLADNTDGAGLLRDIERNAGVRLAGQRVLLLGAGGAAAGVLGPLLAARPATLVIANRTPERAQALLDHHPAAISAAAGVSPGPELRSAALDDCGSAYDVVINATASSMSGSAVPVKPEVLRSNTLAIDLMYGPAAQGFLDWAGAHGAKARDGLGMLVEQAAEAFLFFRGVEPDTAPVLSALRQRLAA